ncbi:MAG: PAS domain-containing protein [Actinomycetota bacterium]
MSHDWMLVETLGSEPTVVAQGAHTKNLIPISSLLRRNPHLMAIQTAISETVRGGSGLSSITPKNDCVIRTEVVAMSDGRIHGVQMWIGAADDDPPPRPEVGSLVWDLTNGTATDTVESLKIGGWDPASQPLQGRAFADDLPRRDLNPHEAEVVSMLIKPRPGVTICTTWDVTDHRGEQITIGFVARSLEETDDDDAPRLVCRAMNWRSVHEGKGGSESSLADRILASLARPGVHRALVDPEHWMLVKWLDDPAPFFDWRAGMSREQAIHPHDRATVAAMAAGFSEGTVSGVLRVIARDGTWTPVHVTVHRIELHDGVLAGLAELRLPTAAELAEARLEER